MLYSSIKLLTVYSAGLGGIGPLLDVDIEESATVIMANVGRLSLIAFSLSLNRYTC